MNPGDPTLSSSRTPQEPPAGRPVERLAPDQVEILPPDTSSTRPTASPRQNAWSTSDVDDVKRAFVGLASASRNLLINAKQQANRGEQPPPQPGQQWGAPQAPHSPAVEQDPYRAPAGYGRPMGSTTPPPSSSDMVGVVASFFLVVRQFIPLVFELLRDKNVPLRKKIMLPGLSLLYIISPIDFVPDFLLGIGWVDDGGTAFAMSLLFIRSLPRETVQGVLVNKMNVDSRVARATLLAIYDTRKLIAMAALGFIALAAIVVIGIIIVF